MRIDDVFCAKLAPKDFPRLTDVRIDARVLVCAIVAAGVAALISGLAPAVRGARFEGQYLEISFDKASAAPAVAGDGGGD